MFINYRFVIPESPRWLLCKGRTTEVAAIIKKACIVNKRQVPTNIEKMLKPPPCKEVTEEGCITLFGTAYLRLITVCFLCIWFTMNLVYYGLILNMNTFGGNVYLNSVSTTKLFFSFAWCVSIIRNYQSWLKIIFFFFLNIIYVWLIATCKQEQ